MTITEALHRGEVTAEELLEAWPEPKLTETEELERFLLWRIEGLHRDIDALRTELQAYQLFCTENPNSH